MAEVEIRVDKSGLAFAKIMTIFTIIGIVLMVLPAIVYFLGVNQYVPLSEAHKYWHLSASKFWVHVIGRQITGYAWIFDHLDKMDCLSMIGVLILMITPLLAMIAGAIKSKGTYRILFLISAFEFIISIFMKAAVSGGAKKALNSNTVKKVLKMKK